MLIFTHGKFLSKVCHYATIATFQESSHFFTSKSLLILCVLMVVEGLQQLWWRVSLEVVKLQKSNCFYGELRWEGSIILVPLTKLLKKSKPFSVCHSWHAEHPSPLQLWLEQWMFTPWSQRKKISEGAAHLSKLVSTNYKSISQRIKSG